MSPDVALVVLVRTGAVLAVALAVVALARRNPMLRVAAARWGLAGAAILALTGPWLAIRPAPAVPVSIGTPRRAFVAPRHPVVTAAAVAPTPVVAAPEAEPSFDPTAWVVPAWGIGSLLLGLHLLAGFAALARVRRGCRPVEEGVAARVALMAEAAGIRPPDVLEGAAVRGPFVAGARRGTVFLPAGWAAATHPETVDAVLRHELAHLANGDLRWGLFGRLVRVALWPQPLVWLLRGPMAAAEEEACDRQVLASGVSGARYAAGLLALREAHAARVPRLGIGAVSARSGFGRRVEAILAWTGGGGTRLSRRAGLAVRGGALGLALTAAWAFARPAAPAAQLPDPTAGWIKKPYAGAVALTDEAGRPVTGARAWLLTTDASRAMRARALTVEGNRVALAGGEGEAAEGRLVASAPGRGLAFVELWPAPRRVTTLRMPEATALSGQLLLPRGGPAAGVRVRASLLVGRRPDSPVPRFLETAALPDAIVATTTDATGAFRLGGLPPETEVQYDADDDRFARMGLDERVETPRTGTKEVRTARLRQAGRIEGRVTRDGRPVAGVRVGAQANTQVGHDAGEWGEAVTDAHGRYAIVRLSPSVYNVAADLGPTLQEAVTASAREAVRVGEGQTVAGQDFALVSGSLIEGTVTLAGGRPVAGTEVGIYGPAHPDSSAWVGMARTDARGHYRTRVPAGAQRVYAMDSRYEGEPRRVTTRDGETTRVDLRVSAKAETVAPAAEVAAEPDVPLTPPEDAPTGPTASFGPGAPFYGPARLRDGVTVRLAFVQDGDRGGAVWRPDGGPARAGERARALDWGPGDRRDPRARSRSLLLRVDVTGLKRGEFDATLQVPHPSGWTVYQSYGGLNGQTIDLATFRANKALRTTDMRFGLGYGPWQTLGAGGIGEGPLRARVSAKDPASVTIRFPSEAVDKDATLVAFAADGRALELKMNTWPEFNRRTGVREATYTYEGGAVARVELRARDYEWTTFKGIALYPRGG